MGASSPLSFWIRTGAPRVFFAVIGLPKRQIPTGAAFANLTKRV